MRCSSSPPAMTSVASCSLPMTGLSKACGSSLRPRRHQGIADGSSLDDEGVKEFLRENISSYKVPYTVEFVDTPLRDDAGKARRSAVRDEIMARLSPPQRR